MYDPQRKFTQIRVDSLHELLARVLTFRHTHATHADISYATLTINGVWVVGLSYTCQCPNESGCKLDIQ